jgi:hypothetical protein
LPQITLPSADWDELARIVGRAERPLSWAWVATRVRDRWLPTLLVVRTDGAAPCQLLYDGLAIGVEELSPRAAQERWLEKRLGSVGGTDIVVKAPPGPHSCLWRTTERAFHEVASSGWPYFYCQVRLPDDGSAHLQAYDELSAPGRPFFPSANHAAAELLFGVPVNVLGHDMSPRVVIALSDRRGAIDSLRFAAGGMEVVVRGTDIGQLHVRASWRHSPDDVTWVREDRSASNGGVVFAVDRVPYEAAILLVTNDGQRLDRRAWTARYGDRPEVQAPTALELVERWLEEQEHGQLEYKQQLGRENNLAFAQDVCAFANTDGGVILLGVDDGGHPVGYPADSKTPIKVADQVTHVIRDEVEPVPEYEIERLEFDSRPLWIIRVRQGTQRPYEVQDIAYVRDHGTSRPATRDEQLALLPRPLARGGIAGLSEPR